MTTPAMSYYEEKIRRNPEMQKQYILHFWPSFHSPEKITGFTLEHSTEIYEFREGRLTVRMSPPHPDWHAPEEYLRTVNLPLTASQLQNLRAALKNTGFPNLRTDPCSLVNFVGGYSISAHFCCSFPDGRAYHFAAQHSKEELTPLAKLLQSIAETSAEYRQIQQMGTWIFDFNRLERLKQEKNR